VRSGARLGYVCREPEVSQDSLNHRRLFNQRDQTKSPTGAWTRQHIDAKGPPHQLGPLIPSRP
jgi:hypothetical protein